MAGCSREVLCGRMRTLTLPSVPHPLAEEVERFDERMEMFLRAADVTSTEASPDARKATTFLCSGVSQVIGNASHNSIVVTDPMQPNIAKCVRQGTHTEHCIGRLRIHGLKAASALLRSCGAGVRRVKIILRSSHILLILERATFSLQFGRHTSMIVFGVRGLFCSFCADFCKLSHFSHLFFDLVFMLRLCVSDPSLICRGATSWQCFCR